MLMAEYSYETDIEVQREEAAKEAAEKAIAEAAKAIAEAEKAAKEATEKAIAEAAKADKRLVEIIERVSKGFHVSPKDACEKLGESYQEYLEIKKSLPPDIHK